MNQIEKNEFKSRRWNFWNIQNKWAPYIFIAPFFICFSIFLIWPIAYAFFLSFHSWGGFGPLQFNGIGNYLSLGGDKLFRKAAWNTVYYTVGTMLTVLPLALILAMVLNNPRRKFKNFFRAMYFLPSITCVAVIAITFLIIYNKDFGLLNFVLKKLGLAGDYGWVESRNLVKPAILGLMLWRWTGYNAIYFLAGLQSIPQELYDAGKVDGANSLQMFYYITTPLLKPIIIFVVTVATISLLQIFTEPYILTGGGPANSSLSILQLIYREGLEFFHLGRASALSFILFIIIFCVSFFQIKKLGLWEE